MADKLGAEGFQPRHTDRLSDCDHSGDWGRVLARLIARLGAGITAAVVGNRGTGKTQMAACLGLAAVDKWGYATDRLGQPVRPVKYTTAAEMFTVLKAGMLSGDEMKTRRLYDSPRLLVIDEIQERANTEYEARTLVQIIDTRYARKLDTVLIGNLKPDAFRAQMGASVISRMAETGGIVELVGEDRRVKK